MSYTLIVADVRRGVFGEGNLDSLGMSTLLGKDTHLIVPDGAYEIGEKLVDGIIRVKIAEEVFLNPLNMGNILEQVFGMRGKPDHIVFFQSSSGAESAAYAAGLFGFPVITDVSGYDKDRGCFLKELLFGQDIRRVQGGRGRPLHPYRSQRELQGICRGEGRCGENGSDREPSRQRCQDIR